MAKADNDVISHYAWLGKLIADDRSSKHSTCDLVLESEGKKFPVHKNIMMLVSNCFKKMFTIETKEKHKGIVKMLQIPHQRLANLVEFIYTERIKITEKNVTKILDDAEFIELEALKEICETALLKLVSTDNCLKLRACAKRYNLDEVLNKANQEIKTNFATIVQQKDFVQLDVDDMSAVFELRNKTCKEAAFTGIVHWVKHNPRQREELFEVLFSQLDLSSMSSKFLTKVSKESLVRKSAACMKLLNETNQYVNQHTYSGKILIVGGQDSPRDCVVYDVNTKHLTHLPKLNKDRVGVTAVKVGSKVYVTGCWVVEGGQCCEMLDLDEPTKWNVLEDMLEHRSWCGSGFLADHIYVTGGWDLDAKTQSSCEKFDIHNNRWTRINNMLHSRYQHGTAACNNSLYCIGGQEGRKILSLCEQYNVWSGVWNEIAPLNQARKGFACVVLNGSIYAIGGYGDNDQYLSTVERFDTEIGKWENVASLQHARYLSSACVIGNKIFVVGGRSKEKDVKSVEVYDPISDVWTVDFETEKVLNATVVAI